MSSTDEKKKEPSLAFGGQAVMEGIMMRSKDNVVICVRQPNDEIVTQKQKLSSVTQKYSFLKLPFIRGVVALIETMYTGIKGIYFSANAAFGEDEEVELSSKEIAVIVVVALCLSVLLFSVAPVLCCLVAGCSKRTCFQYCRRNNSPQFLVGVFVFCFPD